MTEVLVEGHTRRGRPPGRWRNRVKEYMCERCYQRGRAGSRKEGVFGQGEVEALLPWPHTWGTFLEGARHQNYREMDRWIEIKYISIM